MITQRLESEAHKRTMLNFVKYIIRRRSVDRWNLNLMIEEIDRETGILVSEDDIIGLIEELLGSDSSLN